MTQASTTDKKWRARVLKQRPMSFVVAGSLEILAWWTTHGVDLSEGMIDTHDSSPISVPEALEEYQERIGRLAERTPRLAFINKITDDIVKGRKPPHPTRKDSLLCGPLIYANRRCEVRPFVLDHMSNLVLVSFIHSSVDIGPNEASLSSNPPKPTS